MKTWVKGGLIGFIIGIFWWIVLIILEKITPYFINQGNGSLEASAHIPLLLKIFGFVFLGPLKYFPHGMISFILFFILIGAIIGLIIQKVRK